MKIVSFHEELTETCVDILARYMFANAAVQTKRLPTTDFLLKQGNSATWLLNTMLITVTTSLCDQAANRGGLCDRCHLICSKNARPLSGAYKSLESLFPTSDGLKFSRKH
jgi:tuberous sclerosis protein 2